MLFLVSRLPLTVWFSMMAPGWCSQWHGVVLDLEGLLIVLPGQPVPPMRLRRVTVARLVGTVSR